MEENENTVAAAMAAMKKRTAELERTVYLKGTTIIINVEYEYVIDVMTCNTHEKIVAWVIQLCGKTWINPDVLKHFVYVACRASDLAIPRV